MYPYWKQRLWKKDSISTGYRNSNRRAARSLCWKPTNQYNIDKKDHTEQEFDIGNHACWKRKSYGLCADVYQRNYWYEDCRWSKKKSEQLGYRLYIFKRSIESADWRSSLCIIPSDIDNGTTDRAASLLMEGKVVILCDGSPFANVVPITLFHLLNTSEDYNLRWQYGTFLRIVDWLPLFLVCFYPDYILHWHCTIRKWYQRNY